MHLLLPVSATADRGSSARQARPSSLPPTPARCNTRSTRSAVNPMLSGSGFRTGS